MPHHDARHRSSEMNACIEACTTCHATCVETLVYCLGQGGRHAAPAHVALMQTCADICAVSADAMRRGTPVHRHTCGACAGICAACAEDCASMGDDAVMQHCAEVCRRCADECREMAA